LSREEGDSGLGGRPLSTLRIAATEPGDERKQQ
jgi:hypothetical protein